MKQDLYHQCIRDNFKVIRPISEKGICRSDPSTIVNSGGGDPKTYRIAAIEIQVWRKLHQVRR